MDLSDNEDLKMIEKFKGENFYYWKKKMEIFLTSLELWDIVDESKDFSSTNTSMKKKKEV